MRIQKIKLRRFKSLYDVTVPVSDFSVLTGPNGSGKSNLMSAIDFIGETYRYGLEYAVGRAGGIDSIAFRRTRRTTSPLSVEISALLEPSDIYHSPSNRNVKLDLEEDEFIHIFHSYAIKPSQAFGDSTFAVSSEKIKLAIGGLSDPLTIAVLEVNKEGEISFERNTETSTKYGDAVSRVSSRLGREVDYYFESERAYDDTDILLRAMSLVPFLRDFRMLMSRLQVYRLNSAACREPGVLTPNASLRRDGSNLPGFLARLNKVTSRRNTSQSSKRRIVDSMAEIFHGLTDITTAINSSGGLDLQIWEEGVGRPWSASDLSDGTIQYLALLLIILDQRSPLLTIEEPENALHSWILRLFLEKCRSLETAQVLMTTHSPVTLKSIEPDETLLAWKSGGRTTIDRLIDVDPLAATTYHDSGIDVYEQYDSGLWPQTIPGERG